MNNHPAPSNRPLTSHPGWCSPLLCQTTKSDVWHVSDLVTHDLPTGVWQFQLVRSDEFMFDRPGDPELLVTIESDDHPVFEVVIPVRDIAAVVDALLTERGRAQFLSEPVVRRKVSG